MSDSIQFRLAEVQYNGMTFSAHADIYSNGQVANRWTEYLQENPAGTNYHHAYLGDRQWCLLDHHMADFEPRAEVLCKLITDADEKLKHFIHELTK